MSDVSNVYKYTVLCGPFHRPCEKISVEVFLWLALLKPGACCLCASVCFILQSRPKSM